MALGQQSVAVPRVCSLRDLAGNLPTGSRGWRRFYTHGLAGCHKAPQERQQWGFIPNSQLGRLRLRSQFPMVTVPTCSRAWCDTLQATAMEQPKGERNHQCKWNRNHLCLFWAPAVHGLVGRLSSPKLGGGVLILGGEGRGHGARLCPPISSLEHKSRRSAPGLGRLHPVGSTDSSPLPGSGRPPARRQPLPRAGCSEHWSPLTQTATFPAGDVGCMARPGKTHTPG